MPLGNFRQTTKIYKSYHQSLKKKRGEGREKERERNINWLLLVCLHLRTSPENQACTLTRNQTGNIWFYIMMPSPLNYSSQGIPPNLKHFENAQLDYPFVSSI